MKCRKVQGCQLHCKYYLFCYEMMPIQIPDINTPRVRNMSTVSGCPRGSKPRALWFVSHLADNCTACLGTPSALQKVKLIQSMPQEHVRPRGTEAQSSALSTRNHSLYSLHSLLKDSVLQQATKLWSTYCGSPEKHNINNMKIPYDGKKEVT